MKRFLPVAALAIVLATPAVAQQMAPAAYVAAAGAGDLYEKTSSQLVLQSTKDPKVRSFAQGMIRDHNKSTAMVKSAAAQAGLKPKPPVMTPEQSGMVAQLRKESGTARDRTYLTQQQTAHQQALARSIRAGVKQFFEQNPPPGTYIAWLRDSGKLARQASEHTVRSGETLPMLATRYQVSVSALRSANDLKSDALKIGQLLTIPSAPVASQP